jgi:hypothetical protein
MFCPAETGKINLMGNHLSDSYSMLTVTVTKCVPTPDFQCQSDEIFREFVNTANFAVFGKENFIAMKEPSS